jgi:uncharacterized membrane protein YfcA
MEFIIFIVLGLCTGVLAGLLGIGGGVITVPALYYVFRYYGIDPDHLMHISIATALGATLFTSLGTTWSHYRRRAVLIPVLKILIPGLLIGCLLGAILTSILPSDLLKGIFGCMAIFLGIYFFFPKLPHFEIAQKPNQSLAFIGVLIGCLSTLLGVGGGIFMIPVLIGYNVPLGNTVATSSAGTLATAFLGSLLYLWISKASTSTPDTFGFVNIPACLFIGLFSLLTTSWGSQLAHTLPHHLIKRIFALALMATGVTMVLGNGSI